ASRGICMMKKGEPVAANPDTYVRRLRGWKKDVVTELRAAVTGAAAFEETIKWGHIVYASNGPVLLIRAEDERVLFGFWRGKRLREIEPRLKASGKYELANQVFVKGDEVDAAIAAKLAKEAAALNRKLGNPQDDAKKK
ncbi:MAG TPA: DUF1801 domain-containing protein, partial [Hyphomonadaceae bacterium]|nr:DUF1801 domain-containing protein [Hyphomonadaceae bacterium]